MKSRPVLEDMQPVPNRAMQVYSRQTVNIHIDRIRIKAPCMHTPIGKVLYYEDEDFGEMPIGATADQLTLKDGGEKAYIRSKDISEKTGKAAFLELHCCPPLVLQKHNLFGHAVLQDYVYAILDLATQRLGIEVDPFDREQWMAGGVSITEIHLTGNFACPSSAVIPIIQAIDDNNVDGKQRPIPSCITLGLTPTRRSTYHALTIYGKWLQLKKLFKKPGRYQTALLAHAKDSIRAEVKLYSQEIKLLDLGYVMRWKGVDISTLFFAFFNKYNVRYSIQRLLTEDELVCLTRAEVNAYALWLKGVAIKNQYGRTTVWKITKSIFAKTRIYVGGNRRPEALPEIDLRQIFSPENVLPVPDWAIGTKYYYAPTKRGISNVPVDRRAVDELIYVDGRPMLI